MSPSTEMKHAVGGVDGPARFADQRRAVDRKRPRTGVQRGVEPDGGHSLNVG